MAKKGIFLKEEVGFKAETLAPKKTVRVKGSINSAKKIKIKK